MVATRSEVQAGGPSRRILTETPLRAATFLRGVSRSAALRAVLEAHGLNQQARLEGGRLFLATCFNPAGSLDVQSDERARAALAFVHDWAATHLARLRAAVDRLHPEHSALFADLHFSDAATAALAVARWLDRIEALRDSEPGDRALLATLEQRGVGPDVRTQLTAALGTAQNATFAEPPPDDEEDVEALRAMYAWFTDWSTTARSVVKRKDWLILLGLAGRRMR